MMYKGKAVRVYPCSREKFDSLQLDAKRIMGVEPCPRARPGQKIGTQPYETKELPVDHFLRTRKVLNEKFGDYLKPPLTGTDTWHYAQRLLELKWPVVSIFTGIYYIVNLDDLEGLTSTRED